MRDLMSLVWKAQDDVFELEFTRAFPRRLLLT